MAFSKKDNTLYRCNVPNELVTQNILESSIETILDVIQNTNADPEFLGLVNLTKSLVRKFATKFYEAMYTMTPEEYRTFESVCKQRSADLDTIFKLLSTSEGGAQLFIAYSESKTLEPSRLRYLSKNSVIFAYFDGRDENEVPWMYSIQHRPAFYSYLMVNIVKLMSAYNKHVDVDPAFANAIMELAQIPLSVGKLYQEFRPTREMQLEDERASIQRMTIDHQLDKSSEFFKLFLEVKKDIEEGKLPYISKVSDALVRTKEYRNSAFSQDDIYISAKGTSSSYKFASKRLKSIVASLIEIDHYVGHPVDERMGYISHYNKEALEGYSNPGFRTTAITQHKIKSRVIVIGDNPLQDRCNYIHRRFAKFLSLIPSDCTIKQHKGVMFAVRVTNPGKREKMGMYDILCNDIVDATGTLNQEFQKLCIEIVFDSIIASFWDEQVAKSKKTFFHCDGKEETYIQKAGQPQGILGSFDAFAWAHHVIFLMVMKKVGLEQTLAQDCYMVLGDDSIAISVHADPAGSFQSAYVEIANWVNWKIELSKSHIVRHTDKVSSAEFAKITVLQGKITTPVPIRLLSRMGMKKSNYYYFSTIIWMVHNGYHCIKEQIENLVRRQYPDDETHRIVMHILKGDMIPQFKELIDPNFQVESLDKALLQLAIMTSQIKGSFLEALLPDAKRESLQLDAFQIKDALAELMTPEIETYIQKLESPEHKYWTVLIKNSLIEDSLRYILETQDVSLVKALITLTPYQEDVILELSHVIENLEFSFTDTEANFIRRSARHLEFLDGFQLRSLKKAAVRQVSYFEDIIYYTKKFIAATGRDLQTFLVRESASYDELVGQ